MMYGIIGVIVLLLILLICGFVIRKQFYREIDRLEAWKIDIMNRPVIEELGKVKQLNMTGEAEELFERWRKNWEDLLNDDLPAVEEKLFEIEAYTDKYRFRQAKALQARTETILNDAETKVNTIISELNELVDGEKQSRLEIEELAKVFKGIKKQLLTHRHTYGKAIKKLDSTADALAAGFGQYEQMTQEGNYLEAGKMADELKTQVNALAEKSAKIPNLLTETGSLLPAQLAELEEGYQEMTAQGFVLDHLQFGKEAKEMKDKLQFCRERLDAADTTDVEAGIQELKDKMDTIYDILEKEAYAKNYVLHNTQKVKQALEEISAKNDRMQQETDEIRQSYQLLQENMDVPNELEKQIEKLAKRFTLLEAKIPENQSIYSVLSDQLKEIEAQIKKLREDQETFTEYLQSLRKDEIDAREKIAGLKRQIQDIRRMVKLSNIPGLPETYKELFKEAQEAIRETMDSLNAKPLNMETAGRHLDHAAEITGHLQDHTKELVESVMLAERIIQYGNRYRRRYKKVADGLQRAEHAFRSYDYHAALEEAATTVESVEPGAIKKIETMVKSEEPL
ncbi:septation ring formation regulator EzrA [Heyndrickxia acidiproducens]|uniref:septation ring formation regulator EzrA n=1 Tax=Heyndrickxia acidiproducens TaxID=1121084 RepID=UPI00036C210A|nr:septation ring formation regulator EzrA [Heyndrickxia acidiproducens]